MSNSFVSNFAHLSNRLWRRKHFIFLAIILISLVFTLSFTGTSISIFSSMSFFSNKHRRSSFNHNPIQDQKLHGVESTREYGVKMNNLDNSQMINRLNVNNPANEKESINQNSINIDSSQIQDTKATAERYRTLTKRYVPELRMVHLDLKGAPPKVSFFKELFPLLAKAGANGLLLEFEDMFPFEGDLRFATTENAYSKDDIRTINLMAKQYNLEVIPLIQTFGHMEYFLKLQQYRHLREMDEFPQAICPSKDAAFKLITQIVDQIMALYPDSKWLHIGCDEVFHIGMCDQCKNKDHDELFLNHVQKVSKYVKDKHHVIPIIWDDMLRQFNPEMIKKYDFKKIGVEIMIWTYIDDIYRFVPYSQFISYSEIFPNIWGASAFKGAFGETLTVPNIKMHLDNNIAWINTMKEQAANFKNIRGLVITGWQRYDHLATLCELLPSGLPSLIIDLLTVSNGRYEANLLDKFDNLMKCEKNYYYTGDTIYTQDPSFFSKSNCKFPGASIFRVMQEFDNVNKKVDEYLYDATIHKAWITDYNVRHNISSPYRINEALQNYYGVMYNLKALVQMAISALSEVYDSYTVYEWIEQKLYPQFIRLEKFFNSTLQLQKARVWPKRPLKPLDDLQRLIKANNGYGN